MSNDNDMNLPPGMTCGDCVHFTRTCEWLISCNPANTTCDWAPSRFRRSRQSIEYAVWNVALGIVQEYREDMEQSSVIFALEGIKAKFKEQQQEVELKA